TRLFNVHRDDSLAPVQPADLGPPSRWGLVRCLLDGLESRSGRSGDRDICVVWRGTRHSGGALLALPPESEHATKPRRHAAKTESNMDVALWECERAACPERNYFFSPNAYK